MFLKESIRSIIHTALIFAVGFFYCVGSSYTIEVYHDHAHDGHCNSLSFTCDYSPDHGHSHEDSHHHGSETGDEDGDSKEPHDHSHTHSHIVSVDLPAACVARGLTAQFIHLAQHSFTDLSDAEPDGPFYDLIKPPQIG